MPGEVTVSDFLYASGTFTFALGGTMNVDVATGITGTPPAALQPALDALSVLAPTTARSDAARTTRLIYNLPVRSFQIAATNVNVFLGNEFAWVDAATGTTSSTSTSSAPAARASTSAASTSASSCSRVQDRRTTFDAPISRGSSR